VADEEQIVNLQLVYCNHHSAEIAVRERLAFTPQRLGEAYDVLRSRFPQSELIVLSTCNRVEIYAAQERPEQAPGHRELAQFLSEFHKVPLPDFFDDLLEHTGSEVVRHLFQVAASLDSMVLGEPQIVAQVREAYRQAQEMQASGPITNSLFERAFNVSKRVRTETRLVEGRVSIASVAVGEFGKSIFDRFDDKQVLIIGAGQMAEETLRYLRDEGAKEIFVANRTQERAEKLAVEWGGKAVPWDKLDQYLASADIIVSTTGASLVDVARFKAFRQKARGKTTFILDLGAPRDFAPAIRDLDENVFLYCIDDLQAICDRNRKARQKEVEKAVAIIDQETDAFMKDLSHRATGPIVKRLREQWRDVVDAETDRLFNKLPHLEQDRVEIEKTIERMVNKLLHPPLEALKDESREGSPHGLLDALKRLFRIGE
jgi:glutamyl-tRNA reductase